jgi:DNA-binding NarL/FixJ family response regulator
MDFSAPNLGGPYLARFSSCRILLVDDFNAWRASVAELLRKRPQWQIVGEAVDGLEAVEKASETKPDVVLLDIGLPTLSGIDASSLICEAVPAVKVIFLTTYNSPEVVHAAFSNGAQGYVLKAEVHTELVPAIEAVLQGKKFLSRHVRF